MKSYYVIVAAVVMIFSLALYFYSDDGEVAVSDDSNELIETTLKSEKIIIYLTGEVKDVGIYEVDEGSRLYELIEMAGGFTQEADLDSVNLARYVFDGEQIHISNKSNPNSQVNTKVSINKGDISALSTLKGIGEGKAEDIIAYREKNGPFKKLEDIMKVRGIKKSLFNKIKDDICL